MVGACAWWRPPYYSPAMAGFPPRSAAPRRGPGSLERPVNGRLYRGTWLLVGLPLLVLAAFSVTRPGPLPAPTGLPPFDRGRRTRSRTSSRRSYPDRSPGIARALRRGRSWFRDQLAPYGLAGQRDRSRRRFPAAGRSG